MRKLRMGFIALSLMFGVTNGSAQVVEEGTMLIDVYTGYPDLFRAVLKTAYSNSGETGLKIGGAGPFGGRFEYLVADKIGIGADINYTNATVSYTDEVFNFTTGLTTNYDYKISVPRLRAMATFNLHFGNSDSFDGYFKVGAGLSNFNYKFETNDPDFNENDVVTISGLSPVAFRVGVGGRYFFTDVIGMNFEIGLGGGPLLAFGISAKL